MHLLGYFGLIFSTFTLVSVVQESNIHLAGLPEVGKHAHGSGFCAVMLKEEEECSFVAEYGVQAFKDQENLI